MKTFKQLKEELSANSIIKRPRIDSADKKQKYILGPNGKPKKISVAAHEVIFNKQNEEIELDESNPVKHADDVIRKVRNKAAVANLKCDKPAEEKYSKRLNKAMSYRNKMIATESVESDLQNLHHHVTNTVPSLSNTVKMHDMIRNISKTYGVSANKLYSDISNNETVHQKYREAASE